MNKKIWLIMIVTLITMLSVNVFADGRGGRFHGERGKGFHHRKGRHGGFHNLERMKELLSLNDSQVKKIAALNLNHKKKMLELIEKAAPKEIQLRRLLLEDKVDLSKVESLLKEISELRFQMRFNKIKHRLEIRNLLTDEQKMKLRSMRGKMRGKMGRR